MPFITQVLLPKHDNSGRPFAARTYRAFHARMIDRYGGWTRKGQAEGAWLSASGELFTDEHWVYEVGHANRDLRFWQAEKERLKTGSTRRKSGSSSTKGVGYNRGDSSRRWAMASSSPSALITDNGDRVLLRLGGRHYELTQPAVRQVLDLPDGPPGLGISIDGDRLHFEFAGEDRSVTISAAQLQRRLSKHSGAGV